MIDSNKIKEVEVNFKSNSMEKDKKIFEKTYRKIIKKIDEQFRKGNNWITNLNSYFLYNFFTEENLISVMNFKIDTKLYKCQFINVANDIKAFENFYYFAVKKINDLINKNKDSLYEDSMKLLKIALDSINMNDLKDLKINDEAKIEDVLSENILNIKDYSNIKDIKINYFYSNLFRSFEDYLIRNKIDENLKENDLKNFSKASAQLFYLNLGDYLIIMTYSPNNEHYYNPKLPDYYKGPNVSIYIYTQKNLKNLNINLLKENYQLIDSYFKAVIEYMLLYEMNQNIINAMGEASLIAQYWITTSINKILNNYDKELQLARDSELLAELIVKHILTEKIDGVENIEVYPFDRVFYINKALFSNSEEGKSNIEERKSNTDTKIVVYEALLETKIFNEKIPAKKFLNNSKFYVYEWERNAYNIGLEKLNLSRKEYRKIRLKDKIEINNIEFKYDEDKESVMYNLIKNLFVENKDESDNELILNYKKNYLDNGITYIYTSGVDLKKELKIVYKLQEIYLNNLLVNEKIDDILGLAENDLEIAKGINEIIKKNYSENAKVVLFSYSPEEKEYQNKGFTLIIVANKDILKSQMEIKSERDDLLTVLKLLINQHFVIDKKYKQRMDKNFKEIISALDDVNHKINNFLKQYDIENDDLKQQINNFIQTYIKKFKEFNLIPEEKKFTSSEDFFKRMFITVVESKKEGKIDRVKKFNIHFEEGAPWTEIAEKIYDAYENNKYIPKEENVKIGKFNIIVVFNITETPSFKILWKDSFFNEYIHVMLKNAFEATVNYLKDSNKKEEIIEINLFFTKINEENFINIEIINKMSGITKKIYENINSKEPKKEANLLKDGSNGIGIYSIKPKIDSIYGLDKGDLKFIMKDENTMISLLTLPIEVIEKNDWFLPEPKKTFLYFEDDEKEYSKLIENFRKIGIIPEHKTYYNDSLKGIIKKYNVLITDLNFYSNPSGNERNIEASCSLIEDFIKNKDKYLIIILSSDDLVMNNIQIKKIDNITEINNTGIYHKKNKDLSEKEIEHLKELIEKFGNVIKKEKNIFDNKKNKIKKVKNICEYSYKPKEFEELKNKLKDNSIESKDLNQTIFFTEKKEDINIWNSIKVIINNDGKKRDITNPEIYIYGICVKLMFFMPKENINIPIFYEALRHNILLVNEKFKENINKEHIKDEKIKKIIKQLEKISMPRNGILARINHDVIRKANILNNKDELIKENQWLRENFEKIYKEFLNNNKQIEEEKIEKRKIGEIENKYEEYINKFKNLEIELKKDKNIDSRHLENLKDKIEDFNKLYKLAKGE